MPRVVAVIPQWNRRDLLLSLLQSLAAQTRPFDEIVVADNGSTDDSALVASRAGARVLLLGQNLGFAAAVNRAIEASPADWIAILNNDVTLEPDWLAQLLTWASAHPANSDFAPQFATGKILRAGDSKTLDGSFDEICASACACRCGAGKRDAPVWNEPCPIRMAPMTAALFRRELFSEVGPLDERFGSYLEDVDFGVRCALLGRRGIYVPSAVAHHRGSSTLGKWNHSTVFLLARNQVLLARKYFHGQPLWPILVGQLLWGWIAFRHGAGRAYLKGKLAGLRSSVVAPVSIGDKDTKQLREVATAGEARIRSLGRQTGLDSYWRAYFWLSRR